MTQHKINLDPAKPHDDATAEDDEWALRMADAAIEYDDEPDDYDPDDDFDCHMRPDGQCGAAGSEECDFECPVMAAIHREEFAARAKAKRGESGDA